jgi:MFS family permease
MAAIVGAIGALVARGISERSLPTTTQRYAHRIRAVLQFPAIRGFALCFGMCHFAQSACMPFWVIVLRDRGMPVNYYVWLTALTALGEILTLYAWGRIVEVHGYRAVLTASLIPLGLAAPAWLVFSAGWNFGETRAMIDAVPEEYQGEGFAVMVFVVSLTGALGAFAGGFAFEWANSLNAGAGGAEPTLIYLVLTQALLLCGWSLCRFLKGFGEQPSLAALMARLGRS